MSSGEQPTTAELLRRIDDIVRTQERLAGRLESLTESLSTQYLPRGEYREARKADQQRITEVEKDLSNAATFRRQVLAGVALQVIGIVVVAIAVLARVPGAV